MARAFVRCFLIGLPGAGKSTIGRALASQLGWEFHDIDTEIVRRTGRAVPELFRTDGELAFRAMESRLTVELSSHTDAVLAPGGGWAAQPGSLEALPPDSAVVWLRVSPEEAFHRLGGSDFHDRPLLAAAEPLSALRALLTQRVQHYARADLVVDVDGRSIEEISGIISEWLRQNTS